MPGVIAAVACGGLIGVGFILVLWKRTRSIRIVRCLKAKVLNGKVVVVTGASSGLGREIAYELAHRGAEVILACRNEPKAQNAISYIKRKCFKVHGFPPQKLKLRYMDLNLASLDSIKEFSDALHRNLSQLDILINNAGIMGSDHSLTKDGFESHLGINHMGHFYLTALVLDLIQQAGAASGSGSADGDARILTVSSGYYVKGSHDWEKWSTVGKTAAHDYDGLVAYGRSKLANCLHALELSHREQARGGAVGVYCIRPGFVRGTELGRHFSPVFRFLARPLIWLASRSVQEGVQTYLQCALEDRSKLQSGCLYENCAIKEWNTELVNPRAAGELWKLSAEWLMVRGHVISDDLRASGPVNREAGGSDADGDQPATGVTRNALMEEGSATSSVSYMLNADNNNGEDSNKQRQENEDLVLLDDDEDDVSRVVHVGDEEDNYDVTGGGVSESGNDNGNGEDNGNGSEWERLEESEAESITRSSNQ